MSCPFEGAHEPCELSLLPKGSTCVDFRNVPARSSYWRDETDSVTRCDRWNTDGRTPTDDGGGRGGPTVKYEGAIAPQNVAGWNYTTEFDFDGIDERDEHDEYLTWVKYGTDTPTDPTTNRSLLVLSYQDPRRGGSGHQSGVWHVDVNGNKIGSTIENDDLDELRDDPAEAIEAAVEYMEDNPEEPPEYDAPQVDLRGENRTLKYWVGHARRIEEDGIASNVHFGTDGLRYFDADASNSLMTDTEAKADAFRSYSVDNKGWANIHVNKLWEYVSDASVTDDVRLYTRESEEKAVPPYLEFEVDGEPQTKGLKRVWLFPESNRIDVPDDLEDNLEATIRTSGKEFKRAIKAARIVTPTNNAHGFYTEGGSAYTVTKGDVDRVRYEFDSDETTVDGKTAGSWFSPKYLRTIKMVRKPASTNVTVKIGENFPMILTYTVDGMSVKDIVAPRITSEGGQPADVTLKEAECGHGPMTYTDESPCFLAESGILEAGAEAPDWEATAHTGETVTPNRENSVVWFFPNTDGCRCGAQAKQFEELAAELETPIYGVTNNSESELSRMADQLALEKLTLVSDPDGDIASMYGVTVDQAPERATFFIRDGEVVESIRGMTNITMEQPTDLESADDGDSVPEVVQQVNHPSVALVTGQRGSGKSSLAYHLAEEVHKRDGVIPVTVGLPPDKANALPDHWMNVESLEAAPPQSVIVIDEAYAKFHSRQAMENIGLASMVNKSRHCAQSMIFVTQNSGHLDKTAVSEADAMFIKEPGTFHKQFERPAVRQFTEEAEEAFDMLPTDADRREYVYAITDDKQALVKNAEAEFYGGELSKSFSNSCTAGDTGKENLSQPVPCLSELADDSPAFSFVCGTGERLDRL